MRRIKSKDTSPELAVRRLVHAMGFRYRLHGKDLPGSPDLVFRSRKCVIFVHGCFWHLHTRCREGRIPGSRADYWSVKLQGNAARDKKCRAELRKLGWRVLTIWECETAHPNLIDKIAEFLDPSGARVWKEKKRPIQRA
jgi:DNA mismatch endonuclease (patch repair protein)